MQSVPWRSLRIIGAAALGLSASPCLAAQYELMLVDGTIVDGSGQPRFVGDVAIRDGVIAAVGELDEAAARLVVDARGLVVAPGFIDVHSHADRAFGNPQAAAIEGFLRQGVTTAVLGIDGFMALETLDRHIASAEAGAIGVNFMAYIGHNSVRQAVMGNAWRAPEAAELARMKDQVRKAMERGAVGLSSGLMYLPGNHAAADELVALAKVTAPYGGRYDSHDRDPAKDLVRSLLECLDTARAAGVAAHPAHLKAVGGSNFGKGPEIVRLIRARIADGEDITTDLYPYDGAATRPVIALLAPGNDVEGRQLMQRIAVVLNAQASAGEIDSLVRDLVGYWTRVVPGSTTYEQAEANTARPPVGVFSWVESVGYASMRVVVSERKEFEGQMVAALAAQQGLAPFELFRQLIIAEGANAMVTLGAIMEADVRVILKEPWAMVASDGEELNPSHPRGRGTFARLLGRYVREWQVLTLEEAVHKVTGLPADYLRQARRGRIRPGAVADIVVFDPATVVDRATWQQPTLFAEGVRHVLIDGRFALKDGSLSSERLGRFIPYAATSPRSANE